MRFWNGGSSGHVHKHNSKFLRKFSEILNRGFFLWVTFWIQIRTSVLDSILTKVFISCHLTLSIHYSRSSLTTAGFYMTDCLKYEMLILGMMSLTRCISSIRKVIWKVSVTEDKNMRLLHTSENRRLTSSTALTINFIIVSSRMFCPLKIRIRLSASSSGS